jgi:hypothetical protein
MPGTRPGMTVWTSHEPHSSTYPRPATYPRSPSFFAYCLTVTSSAARFRANNDEMKTEEFADDQINRRSRPSNERLASMQRG